MECLSMEIPVISPKKEMVPIDHIRTENDIKKEADRNARNKRDKKEICAMWEILRNPALEEIATEWTEQQWDDYLDIKAGAVNNGHAKAAKRKERIEHGQQEQAENN
jgi:hypothetical protein